MLEFVLDHYLVLAAIVILFLFFVIKLRNTVITLKANVEESRLISLYELENHIDGLLKKGLEYSFLVFEDESSGNWIQIRKYFDASGFAALEICFPKADWSERYLDSLDNYLRNENIRFNIQKENPNKSMEFIYINCNDDVKKANKIISDMFIIIFQVPKETKVIKKGSGVYPISIDIDHVSRLPKSHWETLKRFRIR